jgi:hypothetical protein
VDNEWCSVLRQAVCGRHTLSWTLLVMEGSNAGSPQLRQIVVDDPRAARLLVDVAALFFLGPFVGRELSATAGARELGISLDQMLSRLRRLRALGLVEVVRQQPRAGRAVKIYRAVADEFFVPLAVLALERDTMRSETHLHRLFMHSFEMTMVEQLAAHPEPGALVRRDAVDGRVTVLAATGRSTAYDECAPVAPALLYDFGVWRMSRADAKALQRELYDVVRKYRARHDPAQPEYVVGASLAPVVHLDQT